jgi:hypothetical protein
MPLSREDQKRIASIYYKAKMGLAHAEGLAEDIKALENGAKVRLSLTIEALTECKELAVNAILFDLEFGDRR